MRIEETNDLLTALGEFTDLGELDLDDEAVARFRGFDENSRVELVKVVRELILPEFLTLDEKRQKRGLAVLAKVAALPHDKQEYVWLGLIPPFDYPQSVNLFSLILEILSAGVSERGS